MPKIRIQWMNSPYWSFVHSYVCDASDIRLEWLMPVSMNTQKLVPVSELKVISEIFMNFESVSHRLAMNTRALVIDCSVPVIDLVSNSNNNSNNNNNNNNDNNNNNSTNASSNNSDNNSSSKNNTNNNDNSDCKSNSSNNIKDSIGVAETKADQIEDLLHFVQTHQNIKCFHFKWQGGIKLKIARNNEVTNINTGKILFKFQSENSNCIDAFRRFGNNYSQRPLYTQSLKMEFDVWDCKNMSFTVSYKS